MTAARIALAAFLMKELMCFSSVVSIAAGGLSPRGTRRRPKIRRVEQDRGSGLRRDCSRNSSRLDSDEAEGAAECDLVADEVKAGRGRVLTGIVHQRP